MYILPTPTDTRPLGTFTQPLNRLMSVLSAVLGHSRTRIVQVDPRHFKSLSAHLADHGIVTRVRRGELIARLRFSRRSSDLFLVEFAEFMTNATSVCKAEWLEFCLELGEEES